MVSNPGDKLVRPVNAPGAALPTPGIQPGSLQVITATRVIIYGTGGGLYVYSGTPAAGNLIASIQANAGLDPYGLNNCVAGIATYSSLTPGYLAIRMQGAIVEWLYSSSYAGSYTALGAIGATVASQAFEFSLLPIALPSVSSPAGLADYATFYGNENGTPAAITPASVPGTLPLSQVDTTSNSVGNSTTATALTLAWTVNAGDGFKGTKYVIETGISFTTGQTTVETFAVGVMINGSFTAISTLGPAFNGSSLDTGYFMPARLVLVVDDIGDGTPLIYLDANLSETGVHALATNGASMSGILTTATWDKGDANTLAVGVQWGGEGGSDQAASTTYSEFIRSGP